MFPVVAFLLAAPIYPFMRQPQALAIECPHLVDTEADLFCYSKPVKGIEQYGISRYTELPEFTYCRGEVGQDLLFQRDTPSSAGNL
ncbi:hypothetical protein M1M98_02965 [Thermodesulfovibrionales bacterium]|nr:hypothetical protein [Thermodesulfovibrionales bacterium]MCL0051451.1 hypothetical protein [Thermodesulfovibrionales bacterium]